MESILRLATDKKRLIFDGIISKQSTIIIDFYNCYCSMVKFCTFKTFSEETFLLCMDRIIKAVKGRDTYIVSKPIFEVDIEMIHRLIVKNPNIKYIIVDNEVETAGNNRERDDYTCFLINYLEKNQSVIISNDKYSNFDDIVKNIKPFSITLITNTGISHRDISSDFLNNIADCVQKEITRRGFKFCFDNTIDIFYKNKKVINSKK
jgi:hypothetical protein